MAEGVKKGMEIEERKGWKQSADVCFLHVVRKKQATADRHKTKINLFIYLFIRAQIADKTPR